MNRPVVTLIDLPVGPKPDWELNDGDEEIRKSVPDSSVIFHSLRQSRERWISCTFPRFSTKARGGKTADKAPPPHTIQTRGKCDLEIGPHIFPDTVFYEVHYLPQQESLTPMAGSVPHPPSGSRQSKTENVAHHTTSEPPTIESSSPESVKPSTPLVSSLTAVTTITPALINQVNSAASSNPILANLLQLAAAGLASPDQLKTLGLLIQSLATPENTQLVSSSSTASPDLQDIPSSTKTPSSLPAPIKEFDLVIEFHETSYERWVFPRGVITCERVPDVLTASFDTIIKTRVPFDRISTPATDPSLQINPEDQEIVAFRLKKCSWPVWDTLLRWAGGEQNMLQNKRILDVIDPTGRVYLGYRLQQGTLLGQLQAAALSPYALKPLKLYVNSTRTNRTKRQVIKQKDDSTMSQAKSNKEPKTKRRRIPHPERSLSTEIRCTSCKQTDVPLILGGRFCRPCVDAGRGTPIPPHKPSSIILGPPTSVPPAPPPSNAPPASSTPHPP